MHYTIEILDDYLRGELPADRDVLVHAHLDTCADCTALYNEAAAVRDWIRAAATKEELEFPSIVKARVWEQIRNAAPSPLDRLRAFWRPAAAASAALVAVVAVVAIPIVHHVPAGVAASYLLEEHAAETSGNPLADRGLIAPASTGSRSLSLIDAADSANSALGSGGN